MNEKTKSNLKKLKTRTAIDYIIGMSGCVLVVASAATLAIVALGGAEMGVRYVYGAAKGCLNNKSDIKGSAKKAMYKGDLYGVANYAVDACYEIKDFMKDMWKLKKEKYKLR
ncbi:MAG: hypothetical protein ACLRFI_00100 [Alphaproteobacteria bacterium]